MRLLICAGGTGGGVNPALAVLQSLKQTSEQSNDDLHVLWVGGSGGMEADLVKRVGVPFRAIPAAGVHGVGARALPGNLLQLSRGVLASRRVLADFRPQVLFFTGGYVAVPMAAAARLPMPGAPRPRTALYIPDIEPGLALKALIRAADHVAVTVEETRTYLPARTPASVTGYPLRGDLKVWDPASARQALGLTEGLPTLLILGGSRGARSINRAVVSLLPHLLAEMQIVHATGQLDWPEVSAVQENLGTQGLAPEQIARYHPYPYLHEELGAAFSLADLVISRAGASTLGELPFYGVPAILVPYPYAWRYQKVNAQYLVDRGAAWLVSETEGDLAARLLPLIRDLVQNPSKRLEMQQKMRALARPGASAAIAGILRSLAALQPKEVSLG